jgi:hypothetical protein
VIMDKGNPLLKGVLSTESFPVTTGLNVTIPINFLGFHYTNKTWDSRQLITTGALTGVPYAQVVPKLGLESWTRSFDAAPNWRATHTAPGTFDAAALATLDVFIDYWYSKGVSIIYTLYGTPAWAADTTINFTDQYGQQYGANPPSDLLTTAPYTSAYLTEFITMLVTRYNSGGVSRIQAIEVWNEPQFSGGTRPADYFIYSPTHLARMQKTVSLAAKAVDPSIKLVTAGMIGKWMDVLLSGTVGDGTKIADWCDYIGVHFYDFAAGSSEFIRIAYLQYILLFNNQIAAAGAAKKTFYTECGWINTTYMNTLSTSLKANYIKCIGLLLAASGSQAAIFYLVDGAYFTGTDGSKNPAYDTTNLILGPLDLPEIAAAYSWVKALGGKTITEVGYKPGTLGLYAKTTQGLISTI